MVRLLLPVVAMFLLAGCGTSLVDYAPRTHVVHQGETLYSIAFRYGLDYHDLARWNGLANPDVINVGQMLRLTPPTSRSRPSRASAARRTTTSSRSSNAPRAVSRSSPAPVWQWPTSGRLIATFGSDKGIPSGIGIAGRLGQPVEAAAAGRVVYAGNGLIGYGNLIIIRHNDSWLTAYGHNRRLLVRQGDVVARGQEIAEMGLGPGRQAVLHFEIRLHGEPVDPLRYLPRSATSR